MFNINLYTVKEDNRYLYKSLSSPLTVSNCLLKHETDIINPSIRLEIPLSSVSDKNYMWIPEFNRYYFISNIKSITNSVCEISAHVDVLMTYQSEILNLTGTLSRQENVYNDYLYDNKLPVEQKNIISTIPFPNKSDNEQYVLIIGSETT